MDIKKYSKIVVIDIFFYILIMVMLSSFFWFVVMKFYHLPEPNINPFTTSEEEILSLYHTVRDTLVGLLFYSIGFVLSLITVATLFKSLIYFSFRKANDKGRLMLRFFLNNIWWYLIYVGISVIFIWTFNDAVGSFMFYIFTLFFLYVTSFYNLFFAEKDFIRKAFSFAFNEQFIIQKAVLLSLMILITLVIRTNLLFLSSGLLALILYSGYLRLFFKDRLGLK